MQKLLHDVIENHGDAFPFDFPKREGSGAEILDALKLLTHKKARTL